MHVETHTPFVVLSPQPSSLSVNGAAIDTGKEILPAVQDDKEDQRLTENDGTRIIVVDYSHENASTSSSVRGTAFSCHGGGRRRIFTPNAKMRFLLSRCQILVVAIAQGHKATSVVLRVDDSLVVARLTG